MRQLGLIILLVLASLAGCKTKKSHVVKAYTDSLTENREKRNIGIVALSAKDVSNSLRTDSSWRNAIRLVNFSGVLFPNGKFEGRADEAELLQTGGSSREENSAESGRDSTALELSEETSAKTKVKKRNTTADKEVEGIEVPWYYGVLGLVALAYFIYIVYNRIKTKLKTF